MLQEGRVFNVVFQRESDLRKCSVEMLQECGLLQAGDSVAENVIKMVGTCCKVGVAEHWC